MKRALLDFLFRLKERDVDRIDEILDEIHQLVNLSSYR
jgi:hypothetical protein